MSCNTCNDNHSLCNQCNKEYPDCDCSPFTFSEPACEDGEQCSEIFPSSCVEYTGETIGCGEEADTLYPDVDHTLVNGNAPNEERRLDGILERINDQFCYIFSRDFILQLLTNISEDSDLSELFCEIACSCACSECIAPTEIFANTECPDVVLFWDAVEGAIGYEIQYKPSDSSIWLSETVTGNNPKITLSEYGEAFDIRVRTICINGTSEWTNYEGSPAISCTCDCDPITNLEFVATPVTADTFDADITWDAPSTPVDYYSLSYVPISGGSPTVINVEGTSYTIEGLQNDTIYAVTVTCVCNEAPLCNSTPVTISDVYYSSCVCPTITDSFVDMTDPNAPVLNITLEDITGDLTQMGVVIWKLTDNLATFAAKVTSVPASGISVISVDEDDSNNPFETNQTYVYTIFGSSGTCEIGYSSETPPNLFTSPVDDPQCGLHYLYTSDCDGLCPEITPDTSAITSVQLTWEPLAPSPYGCSTAYTFTTFRVTGNVFVDQSGFSYDGTTPQNFTVNLPAADNYWTFAHVAVFDSNGDLICESGWNSMTFPDVIPTCNVQYSNNP